VGFGNGIFVGGGVGPEQYPQLTSHVEAKVQVGQNSVEQTSLLSSEQEINGQSVGLLSTHIDGDGVGTLVGVCVGEHV